MVALTPPPEESYTESALAVVGANPAIEAMKSIRFRIPGDQVANATKDLPDGQRIAVRWFAGYCRARNLGPNEMERVLRKDGKLDEFYSWASIYAVFTGRRQDQGVNIGSIVKAMDSLRRTVEGETRVGSIGFVETRLSAAIAARLEQARRRRKISWIIGDSQLGKTESGREHARRHNHGETLFFDTPSTGTRSALIQLFCERLNIGQAHRIGDVEMRIAECFDPKMLLIMDNAHRMLRTARGLLALTFLQWLYDARGCGMAFFVTNEGIGNLLNGRFKKHLEQLWRRRIPPLYLPSRTPDDDLALFAAKFELDPAPTTAVKIRVEYYDETGRVRERDYERVPAELQAEVVGREGLGVWLETLEEAKSQAARVKRDISWKAVLKAHCVMQADGEALV